MALNMVFKEYLTTSNRKIKKSIMVIISGLCFESMEIIGINEKLWLNFNLLITLHFTFPIIFFS